ncbi:hypothetical protein E2C01_047301 [Portunus trituberculatus]|uniref:Uncharacterized protein n=1 Tax=Portunus trituberculatus TaxID=210409 RepID=A0A5B7G0R9_PORTR|nr:hypothetical protein [Portunus trituberculatus]
MHRLSTYESKPKTTENVSLAPPQGRNNCVGRLNIKSSGVSICEADEKVVVQWLQSGGNQIQTKKELNKEEEEEEEEEEEGEEEEQEEEEKGFSMRGSEGLE